MQNIFSACETIRFFTEIVTPKNDLHNFPLVCIMHLRFLVSLKKIWKKIFFYLFNLHYSNRQKCNFRVKFSIIDKKNLPVAVLQLSKLLLGYARQK